MNRNHIAWWRLTKTGFALVLYYVAIVSLVVITGLIIWKLIISNSSITEPWSVAGLAATILGVAATLLAILGAVAVGIWWLNLENRVREQVNKLYNQQKEELEKEFHSEVRKYLVTTYELNHLRCFARSEPFDAKYNSKFVRELTHLELLNFIERVIDAPIRSLEAAFQQQNGRVADVKHYFHITDEGKAYLKEMEQN